MFEIVQESPKFDTDSKCCWKTMTVIDAKCSVAANLQFVKNTVSAKYSKVKPNQMKYSCTLLSLFKINLDFLIQFQIYKILEQILHRIPLYTAAAFSFFGGEDSHQSSRHFVLVERNCTGFGIQFWFHFFFLTTYLQTRYSPDFSFLHIQQIFMNLFGPDAKLCSMPKNKQINFEITFQNFQS